MSETKFQGSPVPLSGSLPAIGVKAPSFSLTKGDLSDVTPESFTGKKVVLNIFPSIDTGVCAASVRRFNQEINNRGNVVVLCVSADLPFAQARFCGAEGLDRVVPAAEMHDKSFGESYGVRVTAGPFKGLLARSVVVLDESGTVVYTQLVDDIVNEPDYAAALKHI